MRMCACRGTAGFAHVSCLAEQAKILVAEAEENNLGYKVLTERFARWRTCSLCEQRYHGVVLCALGWACWKTYLGRPEADKARRLAMTLLGVGLSSAGQHADALSVQEAELATLRRLGAQEASILVVEANLAVTYERLGRDEQALQMKRDVYSGWLKLQGEEDYNTLIAANNYANALLNLKCFEEAEALLRKTIPVARGVLGAENLITLMMRLLYARTLGEDPAATLDDLREAVTTLVDAERIARRVFGGAHPLAVDLEDSLRQARAVLSAREGDVEPLRAAVEAMAPGDA